MHMTKLNLQLAEKGVENAEEKKVSNNVEGNELGW